MSWVEVLGFVSGAACVWLATRQSVWNFPVGIANNLLFLGLFATTGLYANAGLQVVGANGRLGYVYYLQGRYEDALREYERGLSFVGSSDHALKDRTAIELNIKMGAAYHRLGRPVEATRHFDRARKLFDSLIAKGADDPFTRYYIACMHALTGDADYMVKLTVPDLKALSHILNDVFLPHESVAHVHSSIVLDRLKQSARLPLAHLTKAPEGSTAQKKQAARSRRAAR